MKKHKLNSIKMQLSSDEGGKHHLYLADKFLASSLTKG